jgi:hypothetical protein
MLKLKLDPTRFQGMPPFYANSPEAWHNMNPIVNPDVQSFAHLRRTPVRNSTHLTPHISGHTLLLDEAWPTLNVIYMENGHCKLIEYIKTDRCTIPSICRLAGG